MEEIDFMMDRMKEDELHAEIQKILEENKRALQ